MITYYYIQYYIIFVLEFTILCQKNDMQDI